MINKLLFLSILIITTQCYLQYCQPSYFFDVQHCEKCQDNCICKAQNTCDSCIDGYTMFKSKCILCPQATGIYGTCSGCCSRETGTVLACTDCMVVPGMYSFLFSGRCILSDGCFEVDSYGFCTQCRNGYYEINNQCYKCHASCLSCTDSTNCIDCAPGYYWKVNHLGLCTSCPSGCATCEETGVCKSCLTSFYQYTDHCLGCPTDCLECIDGSTCTSCTAGILVSNLCIRCDDLTYGGSSGCLSCVENNNFIKCQQCADTFFLDSSTGVCRQCSNYIPGAVRCRDQNTPTQCANDALNTLENRYYLVGISCIQNLKRCKKIADVIGNCAQCYPGYRLNPATYQCQLCPTLGCKVTNLTTVNNVCTCSECEQNFYLPTGGVTCVACTDVNCALCPNNVCTKCKTGRFLSGTCLTITVPVSDCMYYATTSTCQNCNDPFYLGSDGKCYSCQTNCAKCSARFTCTKCNIGYYLHTSQSCVKIPDNCYEFDSTKGVCTLCNHGYYLFEGFCLECKVEKGTLNYCQGLCPIDYYILDLLKVQVTFGLFTTFSYVFIALIVMLLVQ